MTSHRRTRHGKSTRKISMPSRARRPARLVDPNALLTALPGVLGFVPERSFILIAFDDDGEVSATMRHDLVLTADGSVHPGTGIVLEQLGDVCARYGVASAAMAIVDDRLHDDDPRHHEVFVLAHDALAASGGLRDGFTLDRCVEGAQWRRAWHVPAWLDGGVSSLPVIRYDADNGVLGDPQTSPTAVAKAVRTGRRVLPRRSEMVEMLLPVAHCDSEPCTHGRTSIPIHAPDKSALLAAVADAVVDGIAEWDCATLDVLERAILDLDVRDAALGFAVTDHRGGAETLWCELTRRLRGSGRASAATLLGHLHYVAGEGAFAGVAFDVALDADRRWNLAQLLDQALRNGIRPPEVAEIVEQSFTIADNLGVDLPPRRRLDSAG